VEEEYRRLGAGKGRFEDVDLAIPPRFVENHNGVENIGIIIGFFHIILQGLDDRISTFDVPRLLHIPLRQEEREYRQKHTKPTQEVQITWPPPIWRQHIQNCRTRHDGLGIFQHTHRASVV
jgi:hypothetical protein